jgi:hypothetical protein
LWGRFLGGSNIEGGKDIAADSHGKALVTGFSTSSDFPIRGGFDTDLGGYADGFVAKIAPMHILSVWSSPIMGAVIDGTKPGTTSYKAICDDQKVVNLAAPESLTIQGTAYEFHQWMGYAPGARTVEVTMDGSRTVRARYVLAHTLNVRSTPVTGVRIRGHKPGMTDYSAICGNWQTVTLEAPAIATAEGYRYDFLRWVVDDVDQLQGRKTVQVTMNAEHTAQAVYLSNGLYGDANGDCFVNVLDMILVRIHLYEPVTSNNQQYDVNADRRIDILDMLAVRNNARAQCH